MTWEIISSWRVCIQVFWCIFSFWMLIQWGVIEQSLWVILQFVIKAWNFENFIIMSQVAIFLTQNFVQQRGCWHQHFFFGCKFFSFKPCQPMYRLNHNSTVIKVSSGTIVYKYTVCEIQGVKIHYDIIIFQRAFFFVFRNMSSYIKLESKSNADQSFLENYSIKMYGFQDSVSQSARWRHRLPIKCECCCHIETSQLFTQQINWLASIWRQHWRLMG